MPTYFSQSALIVLGLTLGGCAGQQSALDTAGAEATTVSHLFLVAFVGAIVIWIGMICLLAYAMRTGRRVYSEQAGGRLILWGGAVFPVVVLTALLGYTLWLMPQLRPWNESRDGLRVKVVGEQFWWRVTYFPPDGRPPVVSANEIRLPVGERVNFELHGADVIHSFWIPSLGGKMDMIPGRVNRLSLQAMKAGTFRGPCSEYCGTSHALMAFSAVAMEPTEFEAWLESRSQASKAAGGEGLGLFLRNGCGACHAIAGTQAAGVIGPDLSHIGSRVTVGAGILPNTVESIARFVAAPDLIKPGIKMPAFGMLPPAEIESIATYLKGLE